jgi:DNA polymerase-3 subunit delta'
MALKDVIGQDRAVNILVRTLARDRVPSAYLFAGESGIGKRFTALNFAKALNCLGGDAEGEGRTAAPMAGHTSRPDACDECSSCRKIEAMTHPDLVVVAPEKGEIRIGEIRAVEEALSLRPFEGRRKVVIIDDADTMNQAAANAFLKTLEEPPDESLLMLIAAHPDMLPETIRSRCCRLNFVPLAPDACAKVIQAALSSGSRTTDKKRREVDEHRLAALVRLSMGRPGLAVSTDLEKERQRFITLLESMFQGENETWADREEMEQWIDMAFIVLRDVLVWKIREGEQEHSASPAVAGRDALLNPDMADFIAKMSKSADIKGIIKAYDTMTSLKRQLGFNLNKGVTWNYTSSVMKAMGRTA